MSKNSLLLLKQSGVVPFIVRDGVTEVVLVTSRSNKNWVIPKGGIEKLLSPEESAAKEAFEEAGVVGDVSNKMVAEYKYNKKGGMCHVKVYPLEVSKLLGKWAEMKKRKRRIVEVGRAIELIKKEQKWILRKFQEMFDNS